MATLVHTETLDLATRFPAPSLLTAAPVTAAGWLTKIN